MKKILIAVVMAVSAGSAYAGTAAGQLGLNNPSIQMSVPAPTPAKISKSDSFSSSIVSLYEVWLKNNFGDPADKKLVENEMHSLVAAAAPVNKPELILVRVLLSNEKAAAAKNVTAYSEYLTELFRQVRNPKSWGYCQAVQKMNEAEVLAYLSSHNEEQLGESVALMKDSIMSRKAKLDRAEALVLATASEIVIIDASLARLAR